MTARTGTGDTAQERDPQVFATVEEAIEIIRDGGMLIVVDDEDRENEGDFLMAAEKVTPRSGELHGGAWARAALFADGRRAAGRAGHPDDDQSHHGAVRHTHGGSHRRPRGHQHGHLGIRPRPDHPQVLRPDRQARRLRATRACVPATRCAWGRTAPRGTHRSRRRPRTAGGGCSPQASSARS
jgi:hypothetical protein